MKAQRSEEELAAIHALEEVARWLIFADRLCVKEGYGSEIGAALSQAIEAVAYALNVAKGQA